ncbi:MAG: hypothetical protein NTX98_01525, partial [Candidatus Doudnabacteria bacterium]|nr:hypothetical protein [Candidatus Doudnabacteria bacterium]
AMLGPMFEHNMRNAMLTLMADEEHPGTITDIPRIFTDTEFQKYKLEKVKDPVVRLFWEKEMAKTSDFHKSEMLGYLISKVGRFVENTMMRNIVGQPKSGFNFRKIMDEGKVLLVNLSKGRVGEINAKLLGLILVSKIQIAALSRADIPEEQRKDFYLYVWNSKPAHKARPARICATRYSAMWALWWYLGPEPRTRKCWQKNLALLSMNLIWLMLNGLTLM